MEIQGVGAAISAFSAGWTSLTDEEKARLEEILAKYDPENMTDEEKQALMEELRSSGLPRCREVMEAIKEAGFELLKPPNGEGTPGGGKSQAAGALLPELQNLIKQFKAGDIDQDEFFAQLEELKDSFTDRLGILVNTEA